MNVCQNGHAVSRQSDFIIYSVEAENIDKVVAEYGPCKKYLLIYIKSWTSIRLILFFSYHSHEVGCNCGWSGKNNFKTNKLKFYLCKKL